MKSSLYKRLLGCIYALLLANLVSRSAYCDSAAWTKIGDDLELSRFNLQPLSLFSPEIVAVRTSLLKYKLGVVRAEDFGQSSADAKKLCQQSRAVVCINANFFDEQGKVLGLVVSRGITLHSLHLGGRTLTGVLGANHDHIEIIHRAAFSPGRFLEAVQAGPRLLSHGAAIKVDGKESSRRSGLCLDASHHLIIYSVNATFSFGGVTIPELQQILRASPFECSDALNLDGGGSAQLYVSKNLPGAPTDSEELFLPARDNVPVMLGLFIK